MNKKLWIGFYVASFLLFLLAAFIVGSLLLMQMDGLFRVSEQILTLVAVLGVIGYLQFIIVQTVYNFMILAKMWGAIQDGQTPVTVGTAIGFLFIPVYNLYWMFVAWGGFPTQYNNYVDRHQLNAPHLSTSVFAFYPVMIPLAAILVFPLLAIPLIFTFVIARTCDAVNELKAAVKEKQTGVIHAARREQKPKSKLVPAAVAVAVIVPLFFLAGFSVFALRNMNPKATDAEIPEMVGKLKRYYSSTHGSIFGLRSEYSATYKLPEEESGGDNIYYRMIDFSRESDAVERLGKWSYCSGPARQEGAIKEKSGGQIGQFVLCDADKFYSLVKNRYISVESSNARFGTGDLIEFYANLPFNRSVDAAALKTALNASPVTSADQIKTVPSGEKADLSVTAEEYFKDTGGYGTTKNREKYDGKTVEISGRYYPLNLNAGQTQALHAGKNSVSLTITPDSRAGIAKLKDNYRVAFKCRAAGSYSLALENCVLISARDPVSADDKPDFSFSAGDYYNLVDAPKQPYEAKAKKLELYTGKIIDLTGKVKQIGTDKYYLEVSDMNWATCTPDEKNTGQFAALTVGQEAKFRGVGTGFGSALKYCLVVP